MSKVSEDFMRVYLHPLLSEKEVSSKELGSGPPRVTGQFIGYPSQKTWHYTKGYELGVLGAGGWSASLALASRNDWKNLSVDGATEDSEHFMKSLREIVKAYPDVLNYLIQFDGPWKTVKELLKKKVEVFDWSKVEFYHGTSDVAAKQILKDGLRSRGSIGASAAYGATLDKNKAGNPNLIYLTTQLSMATFAASDAARASRGKPVVLKIKGIDGRYAVPDEDSREQDARKSLEKIGSIGYRRGISPRYIKVFRK